eukprot:5474014-Amphidinium_carterae.1
MHSLPEESKAPKASRTLSTTCSTIENRLLTVQTQAIPLIHNDNATPRVVSSKQTAIICLKVVFWTTYAVMRLAYMVQVEGMRTRNDFKSSQT